jgi:hypothetical protein
MIFSYLAGSALMHTLVHASTKEKGENADSTTALIIHIMSMLWPATICIAFVMMFFSILKKFFISPK